MFASSIIVALLASTSLALPSSIEAASNTGTVNFANRTPKSIPYALVGESGVVKTGTAAAGATVSLPMSPSQAGYSLKLAGPGGNPQSSSGILQFEYTYNAAFHNSVSYDWSCVNCNPNPFSAYNRTIKPAHISGDCKQLRCAAGQDNDQCEFVTPTDGPIGMCPDFNGVVLTAYIG